MSETVTVGCKLPHGLKVKLDGVEVTFNGANSSRVVGGYGLTEGIDKDFFDKFMAVHADLPYVKNELIFAQEKANSAVSAAKERADEKTGFEGLDPEKPGNGIQKDEEAMKTGAK